MVEIIVLGKAVFISGSMMYLYSVFVSVFTCKGYVNCTTIFVCRVLRAFCLEVIPFVTFPSYSIFYFCIQTHSFFLQ